MKFLHTADLHLGKVFHEHSLIDDQKHLLDQLAEILSDPSFAALLIAGDVYDRSIPSPDAADLFSAFLGTVKARRPDLQVLVLPGNHDSSSRLGFGRELFAGLGVHLVTRPEDAFRPVLVSPGGGDETCAFFLLPFLYPGSLRAGAGREDDEGLQAEPLRSQARLAGEAAARLEQARVSALAAGADYGVLGAHLFAAGGLESESERVFLGTAERVRAELFAAFDYTALGHLHRCQQAGERAWYSGSPLAYSFEEGRYGKVFLAVELERKAEGEREAEGGNPAPAGAPGAADAPEGRPGGGARGTVLRVTPIPVRPLRPLRSLRGSFDYFFRDAGKDPLLGEAENDYIEAVLTDPLLTENPLALLRRRFPWILSVKQEAALSAFHPALAPAPRDAPDGAGLPPRGGKRRTPVEDFEDFLREMYGGDQPDNREKTAAFTELLEELEQSAAERGGAERDGAERGAAERGGGAN
ncbi:MAG: exonuclease subunit SbcD [Treponema sp.]|jgi:exonuclease SbcD|nr:exonuclease subunit SbcD [Treponema sp.]